jgi:hypothetical protein
VQVGQSLTPAGPDQVVSDIKPKSYAIDCERWRKFFLKIGWCFATKKLGSSLLRARGGDLPLAFLMHGEVDSALAAACARENSAAAVQLFREVCIDGAPVWLWNVDVDTASQLAEGILDAQVRGELGEALSERREMAADFAGWVELRFQEFRISEKGIDDPKLRFHRLKLGVAREGGACALICAIELFGGAMMANAQITPSVETSDFPTELACEFIETVDF